MLIYSFFCFWCCVITGAALLAVIASFGVPLAKLFGYAIQAMDLEKPALIISLSRNGYVGIITVMLMGLTGSMYAVAWSQPMADRRSLCPEKFPLQGEENHI